MTVYEWPEGVPARFYNAKPSYIDNLITTEMDSGRKLVYARSSRAKRSWSVSVRFSSTEYAAFDSWYRDTLQGGAGAVSLDDLGGSGKTAAYYITAAPQADSAVHTKAQAGTRRISYTMELTEA